MEEPALKRLVLTKRLYLEGVEKAKSRHNYADQLLAAINLFLAVETLMGAVILDVEQQPDQAIGTKGYTSGLPSSEQVSKFKLGDYHKFEQLYDQVVAILRAEKKLGQDDSLFKWPQLQTLQKVRNDAQHGARASHLDDLPGLAKTAKAFIDRVLQLCFSDYGSCVEEISLVALIEDRVLQGYLRSAAQALVKEQIHVCSLLIRVAFLLGRLKRRFDWWRDRPGHRPLDDYDVPARIDDLWRATGSYSSSMPEDKLLWEMMTEVRKLPILFENWMLGLEMVDRGRLEQITPLLSIHQDSTAGQPPSDEVVILAILDGLTAGSDDWAGPHFHSVPTKSDCLWACDYVTETVLRWQSEEAGRFTAVDLKYLEALPKLKDRAS